MKRGWIAIGLIAAAMILGGMEYLYLHSAADKYLSMLDEADAHMEQNEAFEAQSVTERLEHRFGGDKRVLHIFAFHSDINALSDDLAAMRRYARTGNTADYLAQSAQLRSRIQALRDLRSPKPENVL